MVILNVPSPAVVAPSAMFFTILYLLLFFSSSTLVSAATGDQYCAPSSCGNLTNIRYPFRLKDDPSNCGDPNYELICDHLNHTILTLRSHSYYVTNIKYFGYDVYSFVIHVKYVGMEKYNNINNGSCSHLPLPASPLTLSDQRRSNKYYDAFGWVTYVNCSKEVKDNVSKYYYRPVPCLSNNNSFIYHIDPDYYRLHEVHNLNYGLYKVRNLLPSCRFLAIFPDNSYIDWYSINQQPTDIFNFLDQGFTLRSFSKSTYSPGFRYCLNESLRENYQYITNDNNSIMQMKSAAPSRNLPPTQ